MRPTVVARAPGKLFLLGEYAVLDGEPAVVAGIDRYAEARIEPAGPTSETILEAPGFADPLAVDVDELPAIDGPWRFVLAVLHELDPVRRRELRGQRIILRSELGATDGSGRKPGLGSSAAITVALSAAVLGLSLSGEETQDDARPEVDRPRILSLALRAHRRAQGGAGSGADVAASVYGGIVRFEPRAGALPEVQPLPPLAGAKILVGWSGSSAGTVDLVARYRALQEESPKGRPAAGRSRPSLRRRFRERSREIVDTFSRAVEEGTLWTTSIDQAGRLIEEFASAAGLPVLTPALRSLVAIARRHGAAAKTSGAGGGDCGVAFVRDPQTAERIREEWRRHAVIPLDLGIAPAGVTVAHV